MALDDDLVALERRILKAAAGDWLAGIDELKVALAMKSPGIRAQVLKLVAPDIAPAGLAGLIEAFGLGASDALATLNGAGLTDLELARLQAAMPPATLISATSDAALRADAALAGVPKALIDDVDKVALGARQALEQARALMATGADDSVALAPLFGSANATRRTLISGTTGAANAGTDKLAEAAGKPSVWVGERDACVRCLAHVGEVRRPGGLFAAGLTYGPYTYDDAIKAPPLHGHCRCLIEVLHDQSYADALKREAQRSVLRGYSLPSESMGSRVKAAERLLADPNLKAPKSVIAYSKRSVKAGKFATREVPPTPPRQPRKPPPGAPKPPTSPKPPKSPVPSQMDALEAKRKAEADAKRQVVVKAPTSPRLLNTAPEAKAWADANLLDVRKLPRELRDEVNFYTGPGSASTNTALRNNEFVGRKGEAQKVTIKALDKAMSQSVVPEDIVVTRMVDTLALRKYLKGVDPDDLSSLAGKVVRDKGYLSTTLGTKPAKMFATSDVQMRIVVPKGSNALWVEPVSNFKSERELLLPRGSDLAIESAVWDKKAKKWLLDVVVVPKPARAKRPRPSGS